jgi:OmpA-OmpF porin, OOP family
MRKALFAVCALALMSSSVWADGFYVAGDVGRVKWASDDVSDTDTAFTLAGGYKFNLPFKDTLALEASYRNLGSMQWDNGLATNKIDLTAVQFSVIANHSLNESVSFYGRLGYADVQIDASNDTEGSSSASNEKVFGGVGGHYAINTAFGIYLEYDKYARIGEVNLSGVLLGVDYQF